MQAGCGTRRVKRTPCPFRRPLSRAPPTLPARATSLRRRPLTHEFQLPLYAPAPARGGGGEPGGGGGGVVSVLKGRRMVVPYQIWMLQGLCGGTLGPAREAHGDAAIADFMRVCGDAPAAGPAGSPSIMDLPGLLQDCRVEKRGGRIYRAARNETRARL